MLIVQKIASSADPHSRQFPAKCVHENNPPTAQLVSIRASHTFFGREIFSALVFSKPRPPWLVFYQNKGIWFLVKGAHFF